MKSFYNSAEICYKIVYNLHNILVCSKWEFFNYTTKSPIQNLRFFYSANFNQKNNIVSKLEEMPKEPVAAKELRHLRMKAKAAAHNKPKTPPSEVFLSVLGNGATGNPRCLYVFTDHTKYIFNCGEGTQRLAHEHKMKLAKLEHLFFTSKSWNNIGGLPGLALTIQGIGVPEIQIHGPPGLENLFEMTKSYMATTDLAIEWRHPEKKFFEDHCMRVDYVTLYTKETENCSYPEQLNILSSISRQNEEREAIIEPTRKKPKISDDAERNNNTSVAFICKLHNKPGHLQLEKCVDQGVPPGPLLGVLKNGKDVTLPNGRIVRAVDVVSPALPGPLFIVLECPNESFIDSLINEEAFKVHQNTNNEQDKIAEIVIHFSPPEVVKNVKYIEWMNRFPASTFHLFLNSDSPRLSSAGIHKIQHALNQLDKNIFPLLSENEEDDKVSFDDQNVTGFQAESLLRYYLRPKKGLDHSTTLKLTDELLQTQMDQLKEIEPLVLDLKSKLTEFKNYEGNDKFPQVTFLGTGSAIPSKVRNVSSIIVTLSENITMLLDCGEGTYGQLVRFFGKDGTEEVLKNLKAVFISHLHADHHLGLVNVLQKRMEVFKKINQPCPTIDVLAPLQIMWWFINYHKLFEPLFHNIRLIPNYLTLFNKREITLSDLEEVKSKLELKEISTVDVKHCKNAYGLVFTTNSDFKLVYSGDTMPCDALVHAGENCSLLIHEATMEDDLEIEAVIKTHSTTSQAIDIGKRMNAKYILLTHFSQRYAKIPIFNENFHSNVGFAFDNMKVQPEDLPKLTLLIPPLKAFFKEDYEEMQEKTAKKKRMKDLLNSVMT